MTRETAGRWLLLTAAIVVALYTAEAALIKLRPGAAEGALAQRIRGARAAHRAPDLRSGLELARARREAGTDAWPRLTAAVLRSRADTGLLPLADISQTLLGLCNETGDWLEARSDEHGFRNPSPWPDHPDVVLVGDSYVQGQCQPWEKTIAGLVHQRHPSSLALGVAGAGPLAELGLLTEYAAALKPSVVLWIYFDGNDATDLEQEKAVPILSRYLDSGYSQDLVHRQPAIDDRLRGYVRMLERRGERAKPSLAARVGAWLTLSRLRQLVAERWAAAPPCCDGRTLRRVFRRAADEVATWGGMVLVASLPSQGAMAGKASLHAGFSADSLRTIVTDAGLRFLDLRDSLRLLGPADSVYAAEGGHLTERGNRVAADVLLRWVDASRPR